jgi:hypothetical protein
VVVASGTGDASTGALEGQLPPIASGSGGANASGSGGASASEGQVTVTERTVSYISLTLPSDFDGTLGGYRSILVREEYPALLKHIKNDRSLPSRGMVVTGQPGIGDDLFLLV